MKTERDRRSIAFFTKGYHLEEEGKDSEAIEAYEKSIEYIDTEMRSPSAFFHLHTLYRDRKDYQNAIRILEKGIDYVNRFNEKKANELISLYPEYKEGILEALETNKPYPADWREKKIEPLFRPHETMLMIDILEQTKKDNI